MTRNSPPTALITGTSTGIGLAAAVGLAQAGFRVTATMRDLTRADTLRRAAEAEGVTLDIAPLDVTDGASVEAGIRRMIDRYGRLDVLVNNAGAGFVGTTEQMTVEEARRVFEVNFFGVWRVTQVALPHMRAAGRGRIISVSSIGGLVGRPFNDAYCGAKFALEGMMESLAPVAAAFGVSVSLIEPGAVATPFVTNAVGLDRAQDPSDPYAPLLGTYLETLRSAFAGQASQRPEEVAQVIIQAATEAHPAPRYQTSAHVRAQVVQKWADPSGRALLSDSQRLLGVVPAQG
ncbi:SDR family oxidoreductase [Deinococcus hopiensis]|uniref:NADP-dependent 3-hydroxy acid dehydrogenase YdfG n=1 Tax=Deinococcus hopiensis KR-140 TaxID=695939 RepID=A0A1W1VCI9_9DEIO|nr:SDR family oxidoreductase [Deinococcus hopiensis]SMB90933.1 NADP-dependent 3-hydroxy acid dehydrogenase YdfG [Deinococcus hopiensis KR-140]